MQILPRDNGPAEIAVRVCRADCLMELQLLESAKSVQTMEMLADTTSELLAELVRRCTQLPHCELAEYTPHSWPKVPRPHRKSADKA